MKWKVEQPSFDGRCLVRGEVVQDDVNLKVTRNARFDLPKEGDEVLRAVLLLAASDDLTGRDVQRGEQVERAVSQVVVRLPLRLAEVHRQDRLRPLERLDLGLLVEGKHDRVVRRVHVKPDDVADLVHDLRIG